MYVPHKSMHPHLFTYLTSPPHSRTIEPSLAKKLPCPSRCTQVQKNHPRFELLPAARKDLSGTKHNLYRCPNVQGYYKPDEVRGDLIMHPRCLGVPPHIPNIGGTKKQQAPPHMHCSVLADVG